MFRPLTTTAIDIKQEGNGGPHIGTYVGSNEIDTKIGKQTIWSFADDDGMPFSIFGFTMLNKAIGSLKPGVRCRITYRGTQNVKTKWGMKDVHQVLVEVDDGHEAAEEPAAEVVE